MNGGFPCSERNRFLGLVLVLTVLAPPLLAQTVLIDEDFSADPSGTWQLNGTPTLATWDAANQRVVVTPAENNTRASMFYKEVLDINDFKLEAQVKLCCGTGADGMTITLVEDDEIFSPTNIGNGGGGMCVASLTTGAQIVVEFDIWGNANECESCPDDNRTGAAGNHVGVEYSPTGFSGDNPTTPDTVETDCMPADDQANSGCASDAAIGFDLYGDYLIDIVVQIQGAIVTVDIGSDETNPPVPLHRVMTFVLQDYTAFSGYLGVTGSTGGANAEQSIYSLKLTSLPPGACLLPPAALSRNISPTTTRLLEWVDQEAFELGTAVPVTVTIDSLRAVTPPNCDVPTELTVEENLPPGWTAQNISDSGSFAGGTVTWVLTGGDVVQGKQLTYDAVPGGDYVTVQFSGEFTESNLAEPDVFYIGGEAIVEPIEPTFDGAGFITGWLLLGPFDQQDGDNPGAALMVQDHLTDGIQSELTILPEDGDAIETDYQPPNGGGSAASLGLNPAATSQGTLFGLLNPGGVPTWLAWFDGNDQVDYTIAYGDVDSVMAYAMVYVTNDTGSIIAANIGCASDDSIQVILNGTSIWANSVPRGGGAVHEVQDVVPCFLNPGINRVMVKVFEGAGGHNFRLRFQDDAGNPITDGLSLSLLPPAGECVVPPVEVTRSVVGESIAIEGVPSLAYVPGSDLDVSLSLANVRTAGGGCPAAGAVTIVEKMPAGWTATDISDNGSFADGMVTWNLTPAQLAAKAGPLTYTASGPVTGPDVIIAGTLSEAGNALSFGVGGQSVVPTDWPLGPDGFIKTWLLLGAFTRQVTGADPGEDEIRKDYLTDGVAIDQLTVTPVAGQEVETSFNDAAASTGLALAPPGVNPNGIPMWIAWRDADQWVDFQHPSLYTDVDQVMAYAVCYLDVETTMDVNFQCGSDDSIQILLDGSEIWINNIPRGYGGGDPTDTTATQTLTAGLHVLMVKVFEGTGAWNFGVRLQDPVAAVPLTSGFTVNLTGNACVPATVTRSIASTGSQVIEGVATPVCGAGDTLTVSLAISDVLQPGGTCPSIGAITISETLPAGWTATNITGGGSFAGGKVTWSIPGDQLAADTLTYEASGPLPGGATEVTLSGQMAEAGNPLSPFAIQGAGGLRASQPSLLPDGGIVNWLVLGPYQQDVLPTPELPAAPDPSVLQQDFLTDGLGIDETNVIPEAGEEINTDYVVAASLGLEATTDPDINPNGVPQWVPWLNSVELLDHQNAQLYGALDNVMAYAATYLCVDVETTVTFAVGTDDAVQVLLDGAEVWVNSVYRGYTARQDTFQATLTAGTHLLMVKTFEAGGAWSLGVAILDEFGVDPATGVTVTIDPDGCGPCIPTGPEVCDNGLDDDCDGLIDGADPDCAGVIFKRGDANRDGGMNIADAVYILQNLFAQGPAILCPDAADSNDDEGVNIADAVYILQNLFAQGPAIPAPGPDACGSDTTGHPTGGADLPACDYCPEACQEPPIACPPAG